MRTTGFRQTATRGLVLAVGGLLAIGIAITILAFPETFYAAYGIEVANDINLINELKAPAGVLFLAGLMMLAGAFVTELSFAALATGATVYLAYGSTRLLSIAVDGVPHSSLVSAAGLEIIIGAICVFVLLPDLKSRHSVQVTKETNMNNLEQESGPSNPVTLVVGGTGKTGRRVVERLLRRGVNTRIGSRSADIPFDWNNQATWDGALKGVSAAYITYAPDLAIPGATEAVQNFVSRAVAHGVERLVLLSGRGEEEAQACERIVQDSGIDWTIVRASWFAQNFSEGEFLGMVLDGAITLPATEVAEPFIDINDIADVVVAALTEDGHAGEIYEVTGPRMLTFAEVAGEIALAAGRDVQFIQIPSESFAAAIAESGVPENIAWLLNYLFETVLDGRNAYLADGVQRALGREPADFADFAKRIAARGAWNADDAYIAA